MNRQQRRKSKASNFQGVAHTPVDMESVNKFVKYIEDLVKSSGSTVIVTFHSEGRDWDQVFDVCDNGGKHCEWGYQPAYRMVLMAKLASPETYPLCVVIRTFTSKSHLVVADNGKKMMLPGKQIRMLALPRFGDIRALSVEDCFACMNTDANTGEALPLDPTLEYVCDWV